MENESREIYTKNFDEWGHKKKIINSRIILDDFFFLEGEIWWTSIGVNIHKEIDGKNGNFERPVLILKKISEDTLWAVPISSTEKISHYTHEIILGGKRRTLLLFQLRFISAYRLINLVSKVDNAQFNTIRNKVRDILLS